MKRVETILAVVALMAVVTFAIAADHPNQSKSGFLSLFKTGQEIALKEVAGRFEISLMDDLPLSHNITAIGPDFLVVEDTAGVVESRIPVYSIRSIVKLKTPKD